MGILLKSKWLALCVTLFLLGSAARAQDFSLNSVEVKDTKKDVPIVIPATDSKPLIPVPEPTSSSMILIAVGLTGLAFHLRRKA